MPVLGLASCVLLATQQSAATFARAGLLLLVGLVLYGPRLAGGASGEPEPYPVDATTDTSRQQA